MFSLFSRQFVFVFVMQPNDAKAKKQHYFKVARGIAMLRNAILFYIIERTGRHTRETQLQLLRDVLF